MSQDETKLINKIKKLLAMANDSGASQNEVEVAMRKANGLLLRHNLTFADVEVSTLKDSITESDKSQLAFGGIKEEGMWEAPLLSILCSFNLCQSIKHITTHIHGGKLSVIGRAENVETVLYLFDIARTNFRRLSKEAYNTHRKEVIASYKPLGLTEQEMLRNKHMGYRMPWIRSYLKGCILGVKTKLEIDRDNMKRASIAADENKFGLMVLNNDAAIELFKDQAYEDLRDSRPRAIKATDDHGAFSSGLKTGKNIEFNKAVGNHKTNNLRIA